MPVLIRQASLSDCEAISRLTNQLGYDVESRGLEARLARILERSDQRFLVAESEAEVVGWIHVAVWEFLEADAFAIIAGLVVDANHRRKGIGKTLMDHAERWAREDGRSVMRLWSSQSRTAAHQFYESLGYARIKTQYAFAKVVQPAADDMLAKLVPKVRE
jgi:N-acetylglutamate synthase-like GNAT family acetyltransferase